jgi:hypothetical protein
MKSRSGASATALLCLTCVLVDRALGKLLRIGIVRVDLKQRRVPARSGSVAAFRTSWLQRHGEAKDAWRCSATAGTCRSNKSPTVWSSVHCSAKVEVFIQVLVHVAQHTQRSAAAKRV